jgi:hypothetical protein
LYLQKFPLIDRLQDLANGSEGKLALPGDGKAAKKTGEQAQGKAFLDALRSVDVMHPSDTANSAVTYEIQPPTAGSLQLHERDRAGPGSRWWKWESPDNVKWLEGVTIKAAGKLPALCNVSVLLSARAPDNSVHHICDELLHKLPVVKGEMIFVADGIAAVSGELVGQIGKFQLELFDDRCSSWPELADITIKAQPLGGTSL